MLTFGLVDFRDESNPSGVVDVTGYAFELVVREVATEAVVFRLEGEIVDAAQGLFSFTLSPQHTNLPPKDYSAELRWWAPPDAPEDALLAALSGDGAGDSGRLIADE